MVVEPNIRLKRVVHLSPHQRLAECSIIFPKRGGYIQLHSFLYITSDSLLELIDLLIY